MLVCSSGQSIKNLYSSESEINPIKTDSSKRKKGILVINCSKDMLISILLFSNYLYFLFLKDKLILLSYHQRVTLLIRINMAIVSLLISLQRQCFFQSSWEIHVSSLLTHTLKSTMYIHCRETHLPGSLSAHKI